MAETVTVQVECGGCYRLPKYQVIISSPYPSHQLIITQDPIPGTLLQVGVHSITITITDPAGRTHICEKTLHIECSPVFYNTEQVVECPAGQTGDSVTIAAGLYSGTTQEEADAAALAAGEAQLVCCSDNAALIAGNLNSAVYDPVRDVIWGTGTPGHILKFNSDTGALIENYNVFGPDWGNDGSVAYHADNDRLYSATRISYASGNIPTQFKLYEINPDTLAITNSVNLTLMASSWATNGGGLLRIYSANGNLFGIAYELSTGAELFVINPATVFPTAPGGSYQIRRLNSVPVFGDVVFDNRIDPIITAVNNEYYAPNGGTTVANRYSANTAVATYVGLPTIPGPAYGIAYSSWNERYYVAKATRYITKMGPCLDTSEIDTGRANADPYNIRFNPYTYYLYVPNWNDNTVAIISPVDDSITIVSGFDSPYDIVFTPTRTFAVQHSREGLKEVVASLSIIPSPTPAPPDPAMVKRLLSYYGLGEVTPGPWLDSKGTNHLVPGPGCGFNSTSAGTVNALAIQADGKILAGGLFTTMNGSNRNRLARINDTGAVGLDSSFVPATVPGSVRAIAVQADTKIVVGGITSNRLVRMNASGVNEGAFAPAPNNDVFALAIQSGDQKIVVGGTFSSIAGRTIRGVTRLTTAGANDTTWNAGTGVITGVSILTGGTGYSSASGVAVTGGTGTGATFDIIVRGEVATATVLNPGTGYVTFSDVGTSALTGVGSGASFDITDDGGGGIASVVVNQVGSGYAVGDVLIFDNFGNFDATVTVATIANGAVASAVVNNGGTGYTAADVLTLVGGGSDATLSVTTLAGSGTGVNSGGLVNCLAIDGSGNILIGGFFTSYNDSTGTTSRAKIARLLPSGKLDTTFNPGTGANFQINGIAIQGDGKIIIVGDFTSYNGTTKGRIARLNTDGTLDSSFTADIAVATTVSAVAIQADGKIVVGYTTAITLTNTIRFNTDGTTDASIGVAPLAIAIQANQKIVLGSGPFFFSFGPRFGPPCRINADFSPDTTFNPGPGAVSVAGIQGNAVQFNSAVACAHWIMNLASDVYLDPRKGWTLTYWIKHTANAAFGSRGIQVSQAVAQNNFTSCNWDANFTILGGQYSDGLYNSESLSTNPTLNVWYFVRVWVDPVDRKLRFQVTLSTAGSLNGTIQVSPYKFDRITDFISSVIMISQGTSAPASSFIVDELAIYEGALSDADAAINYGAGAPPAYAGVFNP